MEILDYESLVKGYNTNLDVTLRGFRPADAMLDTWVPDDDPIRSLCNLVEAAQLCGSDAISVRIAQRTLKGIEAPDLHERLSTLGQCDIQTDGESLLVTVTGLHTTAAFGSIRVNYRRNMLARMIDLRNKRAIRTKSSEMVLRAMEGQVTLAWSIETEGHSITDAVFDSPVCGPTEAALDCLCDLLIRLPIQEARDHSIVRLELMLRDPDIPNPVDGIVLPHNADPIFLLPERLVKRLYDDYLTAANYQPSLNCFDPGPGREWKALEPAARERRVVAVLSDKLGELGIHAGEVTVTDCRLPYAVTIRFSDSLPIATKPLIALRLERLLRRECDSRLELFCEAQRDMSRLRRTIELTQTS